MAEVPGQREVESDVPLTGRNLVLSAGVVFVAIGVFIGAMEAAGRSPAPRFPFGFMLSFVLAAAFTSVGGIFATIAIRDILRPDRIRHAAPDVLPDVPRGPEVLEGSTVHGNLKHELAEDARGWELRPNPHSWRSTGRFLLGFWIFMLALFSGVLGWIFHREGGLSWPVALFCGAMPWAFFGGIITAIFAAVLRSGYLELCRLRVPRDGGDVELVSPKEKWRFHGVVQDQSEVIPRDAVVAVQLCPWKFLAGDRYHRSSTWAVQGLLVLADPADGGYRRLPLLLTNDGAGAARLMRQLADVLQVPYLFGADAEGWKAEAIRAKGRPPLRSGGWIS